MQDEPLGLALYPRTSGSLQTRSKCLPDEHTFFVPSHSPFLISFIFSQYYQGGEQKKNNKQHRVIQFQNK